jgi:O-antigen biosynthesis protein WbqP
MIIRLFDIILSFFGLIFLMPIISVIFILCYFDSRSPIFKQERMGKFKQKFTLYKFRTMYLDTESVPTHLSLSTSVTPIGLILRKTKLDEIPQLFNVLIGDMSLVGPRPNLMSQNILINERSKRGIYNVKPGITGFSQIKKIDMSNPILLSDTDSIMITDFNIFKYFKIIFFTLIGKGFGDNIIKA